MAHRCDIFAVTGRCGVVLPRPSQSQQVRKPRECVARKTLKRVGRKHGEPHLELVLRLIVESHGNASALYGDVIWAVSEFIAAWPQLMARGSGLYDDFDRIDLVGIRREAKAFALPLPISHIIITILAIHFSRAAATPTERTAA